MFAMNLPQTACTGLAGFAIARGSDAAHLTYLDTRWDRPNQFERGWSDYGIFVEP